MRRIRYCVATSLDGYIAGPNGESDWIVMDPEIDFNAIFGRFDTLLIGRKTFEGMGKYGGGGMPGVKSVVLSRTMKPAEHPKLTIFGEDSGTQLAALKEQPGKDIWLFGGGDLFRSLLDAGLVDTVEVGVIPMLLGGGVPLLPPRTKRATLKLTGHKVYSKTGTVALEYAVEKSNGKARRKGSTKPLAKKAQH